MALSFGESKQKLEQASTTFSMRAMPMAARSDMYTPDDTGKYKWYDEYIDTNISMIDSDKKISVNSAQFNITQESNSQYIPFRMDRYYDGIDLSKMTLTIHYVNSKGFEEYILPVNVQYNDLKIQFAWLVGQNETSVIGDIKFEIIAQGINEKGETYIWKTKPNGKLNVLESLTGVSAIEPSESTWYTSFVIDMNQKIAEAAASAKEAEASAQKAIDAANSVAHIEAALEEVLEAAQAVEESTAVVKEVETSLSGCVADVNDAASKAAEAASSAESTLTSIETAAKEVEDNTLAAKTSETNAKESETSAKTSETNAKTSETNAETAATNAATSATNAATAADNASNAATSASTSASSASTSATSAADSASTASSEATRASESATAAAEAASEAAEYAKAAADLVVGGSIDEVITKEVESQLIDVNTKIENTNAETLTAAKSYAEDLLTDISWEEF